MSPQRPGFPESTLLKYWASSTVSVLIDWGIFFFLSLMMGIHYQLALIVSFSISGIVNFALNHRFTFPHKVYRLWRQFSTFFTINMFYLLVTMAVLYIFIDWYDMHKMAGRILASGVAFGISYLMQSRITFNKRFFK